MRMPRGASAGFERDASSGGSGWLPGLEQRVNADRAGKPIRWPLAGRLRTNSFDFHVELLMGRLGQFLKRATSRRARRISAQVPPLAGRETNTYYEDSMTDGETDHEFAHYQSLQRYVGWTEADARRV